MKIIESNAKFSQISSIGERVRKLERDTGEEYLFLNQGVNAVVPISLDKVIPLIDFNAKEIQVYAPMKGRAKLKQAINDSYFNSSSSIDNILIDSGGMSGLDLVFQTVEFDKIMLPSYFWGSYAHILNIRKREFGFYDSFGQLNNQAENIKNSAVLICDPNNPIGNKYDDETLLKLIRKLNSQGTIVIIDSPYRMVFNSDNSFYEEISKLENVILVESFSKSIGLSGQRIGFVYSQNKELITELSIRLMYATNGVNAFAQLLVEKLLTTEEGIAAVIDFKARTTSDIKLNIDYLRERGFLSEVFYEDSIPQGIFVIVNISFNKLLENRIASVGLDFFTKKYKEEARDYSRICVSVPHKELKKYFDKM